jgi:hypothetical protein
MAGNIKNLRSEVSDTLVRRGFRRFDRMHLLRVDKDWSFWVDTGPIGKSADISPFVGIRHDGLEVVRSELMGLPHDESVGSLGANAGYILNEGYRHWKAESKSEEVLGCMDKALERLKPLMNLKKINEGWKIQGATTPGWQYREIIVFYLLGQESLVLEKLRMAHAVLCKRDDNLCKEFKGFEQRLLKKLNPQTNQGN